MKGNFTPLVNNIPLTNKINAALGTVLHPDNIITSNLSAMSSEDFQKLVTGRNNNTPYNYLKVGIANPTAYARAIEEGRKAPFFHHAGNYLVDLRAIPLGTEIGATALLTIFNK
jgi:hippurate hydrolase